MVVKLGHKSMLGLAEIVDGMNSIRSILVSFCEIQIFAEMKGNSDDRLRHRPTAESLQAMSQTMCYINVYALASE